MDKLEEALRIVLSKESERFERERNTTPREQRPNSADVKDQPETARDQ